MSELVIPEKRKPLSKFEYATLFLSQMGKCPVCNERLQKGKIVDEHLQALDHLGSNDLSNRALYCRGCATAKTKGDLAASWKGKRIRGEVGQRARREARGCGSIKSAGFRKHPKLVRGVDGIVRERT
jgi:hypothetical protein